MNLKTIPETKAENETENYLNTMKYRLKTKLKTRLEKVANSNLFQSRFGSVGEGPNHPTAARLKRASDYWPEEEKVETG